MLFPSLRINATHSSERWCIGTATFWWLTIGVDNCFALQMGNLAGKLISLPLSARELISQHLGLSKLRLNVFRVRREEGFVITHTLGHELRGSP